MKRNLSYDELEITSGLIQNVDESERKKQKNTTSSEHLSSLLERYEKVLSNIKIELSNTTTCTLQSKLRKELDNCHNNLINFLDNPILNQPKQEISSYTEFIELCINDVLPDHILSQIFSYLNFQEFRQVSRTCMMWRRICFTIQSALSSFDISEDTPVESAFELFMRFVEWRIEHIRKVIFESMSIFVNCGYKFSGVKYLSYANSMSLSGFPNIERVKEFDITSTFFGDMYKYPGLESIKFLKFKDAVIDFFHCSMFGLTLVESLLPLIDFEKVDKLKLLTNSKLLHSLVLYSRDNPQSKANQLFQNINSKVKELFINIKDSYPSAEDTDEELEGEASIPLSNLEKLDIEYATLKLVNMLRFNPEKLRKLKIGTWISKYNLDEMGSHYRDDNQLLTFASFHNLMNRSTHVESLDLGRVNTSFFRRMGFSRFSNLAKLKISEIGNRALEQIAPKLQVLKIQTIVEFDPETFKLFSSLRKLWTDTKYITKVDLSNLPKLTELIVDSKTAQYSVNINSDSLRKLSIRSGVRNLAVNAVNLEKFFAFGNIDKLSIRSNRLVEFSTMLGFGVKDLSILSKQLPNHDCENVSPLKELYCLSNCLTIRQLHCPYLTTITVSSMVTLSQLVELDQTALLENVIFEKAFIEPDVFKRFVEHFENLKRLEFLDCSLESSENAITEVSSTVEAIDVNSGTPEMIGFLTSLFSRSPSVKSLSISDTEVEESFIQTFSQPKVDHWKNLEVLSIDECENISGKIISDFYSNIEHYSSLKSLSITLAGDNEICYDARLPQTLESFHGLFNSVEIVPTPTARSNIVNLKRIRLCGTQSTENFDINIFLKSLFNLFVDDKEEMAPFRSELHSLQAYKQVISQMECSPPDFKLLNKIIIGIPSIRIVSKHLFIDDPVTLLSQRANLKLFDY